MASWWSYASLTLACIQVLRYKRTLASCLDQGLHIPLISAVNQQELITVWRALSAYKDRMVEHADLTEHEREEVESTDWLDDFEELFRARLK